VSVVGGFTNWCQVATGYRHSIGVRQSGTAWAWGCGGNGRLGDNTTVDKSSPVSVVGGFTDWCQFSGGGDNSLAIRQNGSAWAWGLNNNGQLGDNTTVNKSSPVSVVGGFTDWCQVNASRFNGHGIRTNGTLWAWGSNYNSTLGDNTTVSKSSPVSVVGGFTDWCQISFGYKTAIAVRQNGTAWAWGQNQNGSVGDCTTISRSSPVSVVGGQTWCQVSSNGGNSNTFSFGIKTTVAGF
jgi:alpha-tubulin suppressor-like RCC1 family protein